jgi:hypothetical protein
MSQSFSGEVERITEDMRQVLLSKRHDYGPGNLSEFGEYGILVRVSDKFHRLKTLLTSGDAPKHEAIEDTWLDLANYAVLALIMRAHGADGFKALPLVSDHDQD